LASFGNFVLFIFVIPSEAEGSTRSDSPSDWVRFSISQKAKAAQMLDDLASFGQKCIPVSDKASLVFKHLMGLFLRFGPAPGSICRRLAGHY
jgi:hypothetical protein